MLRRVTEADSQLRTGRWKPLMGQLLTGKTVGIVGLGRIGRRVAQLLKPFHVKIIAFDHRPHLSFAARHHIDWHDLESLLHLSDIVSLHLSLDASTRGLIGHQELKQMKKTAYLVNTSRGELIDDQALAVALESGHLQGAAVDVFAHEPYTGPLLKCSNAVLTCHMGSYATETRVAMETQAARNLIKALAKPMTENGLP
jgi:D-3-phosphoglycerate dehydrogenase